MYQTLFFAILAALVICAYSEDLWRLYLTYQHRAEYKVVRVPNRSFVKSLKIRDRMEAEGWRSLYPSGAVMRFWRPVKKVSGE